MVSTLAQLSSKHVICTYKYHYIARIMTFNRAQPFNPMGIKLLEIGMLTSFVRSFQANEH